MLLHKHRNLIISAILLIITAGFIAYICSFKILDRDFWWHITAGKIMVEQYGLIAVEPFAYTRAGLPYTTNYEWLAQIILYFVHHLGGTTGIILFRTFMIGLVGAFLIFIDAKRIWPNIFVLIYMLTIARPGFMDRPQLFTFVLTAVFIWLSFRILDADENDMKKKKRLILWFIPLEILWVNAHGAAALFGIGIFGALIIQNIGDWARAPLRQKQLMAGHIRYMLYVCAVLFIALFASPNGYHNLSYLNSLLHDKTIAFIGEWQPRAIGLYLADYWPLWIIAIIALALARRKIIFSALVLVATGYLSRQALRHEMLFAFVSTGVIFYQLKHYPPYNRAIHWFTERLAPLSLTTALLFGGITYTTRERYDAFAARDHLYGYGVFDLARGAYDFIEKENIHGHMFNTYGIGGYLMYRGYPNRQIYIDGRNVDYGFDFMAKTYLAQKDPNAWQKLEDEYELTYAIIDYDAIKEKNYYPFAGHLDKNPQWPLIYLDDWVAVYLKDTAENKNNVRAFKYALVTPENLDSGAVVSTTPEKQFQQLEKELLRIVVWNADGVKGRIALAKLYMRMNNPARAKEALLPALHKQPYRPEIHQEMANAYSAEEKWAEAGRSFERAITLAGNNFPDINYSAIADIFAKAGNAQKEQYYRMKAGAPFATTPQSIPKAGEDSKELKEQKAGLLEQLASAEEDALAFNNQGVLYAQQGNLKKAEELFMNAIKINPRYAEALNNLGTVYAQKKKISEARTLYQKAIENNPKYADAYYNLAILDYNARRYADALAEAKKADALGRDAQAFIAKIKNAIR